VETVIGGPPGRDELIDTPLVDALKCSELPAIPSDEREIPDDPGVPL